MFTSDEDIILDQELESEDKALENDEGVSQVSQNIISYTQLYSIETLFNKLKNNSLGIPNFQRKWGLWSLKNQSLFIESMILQLPIPSIVVFSDGALNYKVIDWLQRVTTIKAFLEDGFELSWLKQSKTELLNGYKFSQLEESIKNQIYNSTISVITVQCTPDDERANATYYEIFWRLNQGWLVLTPQEIRNAIYKWNFLDFIRWVEESWVKGIRDNETWRELYKIRWNDSPNYARERDVELLLKIFALAETPNGSVNKNMGEFINDYLAGANKKNETEISELRNSFMKAMEYLDQNDIINLFKTNKVRKLMWYNMLLSVLISYYKSNPNKLLPKKDFIQLISRDNLPDSSSDTWNVGKIKKWKEIFEDFIIQ
jgi:hypothetical protein